ncbi:restriction endonuclease subunit S [Limnohabitans parvus]|uniref:Type I restriction modification DNA specificity domain-containing protein n=1 Tax=Limnohabitans parvus II-B4 TaxID=1293052 RepID=A0A315EF74_9BURK|nr:restriction endonuclease subunit S [Limnohabitans parvus]PUE55799.1 hypothetical protein B9Z37_04480 [Limnohabitans parvus II-B4]
MKWQLKKLGDYIEVVMGQAPLGEECNKDGVGTIFVKAGEFGERSPTVEEWTTNPLKIAEKDDTLVCVVGATAGKINYSSFRCAIGRSVAAVRANSTELNNIFLYYFLKSNIQTLRGKSQGAAQAVITREMLKSLEIPLPPITEQLRIVGMLTKAEKIKDLHKEGLLKATQLIDSVVSNEIFAVN